MHIHIHDIMWICMRCALALLHTCLHAIVARVKPHMYTELVRTIAIALCMLGTATSFIALQLIGGEYFSMSLLITGAVIFALGMTMGHGAHV